jgi:hypothetical protein
MRRRWSFLGLALVLSLSSVAGAQPHESNSHAQAASELLEVMHVEKSVDDAIDIMVKAQIQSNPDLAQVEDLLRAFLTKYMAWSALHDDYAQLYVDTFTEDEIRQLVSFYRTPLGQKVIDTLPQIMRKGAELGQSKVTGHLVDSSDDGAGSVGLLERGL